MIKSKFKRVTSLFLATLMCVTTFAGIGSTTAYAASGEKADVYARCRGMMICFSFCIITIGTDIYLPEIFRLRILYLITEHTDFLVLKPYAGQGREYSPFFLSIHVIRRKKNRAAVFLL